MTDDERYEFDLRGYLVIRGVLDRHELAALNDVISAVPSWADPTARYIHVGLDEEVMEAGNKDPSAGPVDVFSGRMLEWGAPFRRLVAHPRIAPFLQQLCGHDYRFDHAYAVLMRPDASAEHNGGIGARHALHNGGTPFDRSQYYFVRGETLVSGLTAVSFALSDVGPGDGGFCVIPGSHKSAFPLPGSGEGRKVLDWLVQPVLDAGDCIVFTEALTHGALPWRSEAERRTLLYKYAQGFMQWEAGSPFACVEEGDWTPAERAVLHGPRAG